MAEPLRILMVDDNPEDRALAGRALAKDFRDIQVTEVFDAEGLARALEEGAFEVVITDYQLRWTTGLSVLGMVKARRPEAAVIMFTGTGSEEIAVAAMKAGLDDYVLKSPRHYIRLPAAVRQALARSEAAGRAARTEVRLQSLLDQINVGIFRASRDGRILEGNPALLKLLGASSAEEARALPLHEMCADPGDRERILASLREGRPILGLDTQLRRTDGTTRWISLAMRPSEGAVAGAEAEGLMEDVTERKLADLALRESEALKGSILQAVLDAVITTDAEGRIIEFNPAAEKMFGYGRSEVLDREVADLIVPPRLRQEHGEAFARAIATGESAVLGRRLELTATRADGSEFPVEIAIVMIRAGGPPRVTAFVRDLTERKEAAEALRRSQEQLLQSQKLEGIGRLAGGVAHDFNNLLTAIKGYSHLMFGEMEEDHPLRPHLEEIDRAAERAASLTRQLLAFSRRQVLSPKVLDLNQIVAETEKMLRRLIGEDVDLVTVVGPNLGRISADPGQVEQILMNLAVNARDAMPRGGRLAITTANVLLGEAFARVQGVVKPGPYVMLSVNDTGVGMDAETQSRIFEPFFTTKEREKGTGLGLSTVYGIVKQSGGYIWVQSEPGSGATFKIYLPRVEEAAEAPRPAVPPPGEVRGTETILIVEDEDVIRALIRQILRRNGYAVIEARDGGEALHLSDGHDGPIQLMVTDVVMPKMSGRELADRLAPLRPETRVLYLSGYTTDAIVHHGVLDAGVAFLQKPFTPESLARKVREVIDAPAPEGRDAGAVSRESGGP